MGLQEGKLYVLLELYRRTPYVLYWLVQYIWRWENWEGREREQWRVTPSIEGPREKEELRAAGHE